VSEKIDPQTSGRVAEPGLVLPAGPAPAGVSVGASFVPPTAASPTATSPTSPTATSPTSPTAQMRLQLQRAAVPTEDPIGDPPSTVSAWNVANALTVFRLALVPVFVVALFAGTGHQVGLRVLAWAVFAVASVTDRIDGEVARKRNLITDFGKLADPIADKALIGAALIGLSVLGDLPWWVTVVMLVREVGVTLLRFWVLRHGVIPASRGGKLKTLLQSVGTGLFVLLPIGDWVKPIAWVFMALAVIVAVVTGFDYVARAVRLRRGSLLAAAGR
jgi:CDP-diacylglycerol--glycerol-3-phosphate 3-phosphatidyltransferase